VRVEGRDPASSVPRSFGAAPGYEEQAEKIRREADAEDSAEPEYEPEEDDELPF
jgi:hypothetical protein